MTEIAPQQTIFPLRLYLNYHFWTSIIITEQKLEHVTLCPLSQSVESCYCIWMHLSTGVFISWTLKPRVNWHAYAHSCSLLFASSRYDRRVSAVGYLAAKLQLGSKCHGSNVTALYDRKEVINSVGAAQERAEWPAQSVLLFPPLL